AFVWLCRRSLAGRDSDVELKAAILVFVASPGLVLLVHLVGYLDHLGLLFVCAFAAATTSARTKWQAYAVAALTGPVLALVHEAQTILFMPVVLFVLACRECRAAQGEPAAKSSLFGAAWRAVLPLAAVLALALGVSAYVSLAAEPRLVGALDHWLHQRADFTLHYGVFRALKTGTPVSLLDKMYDFWSGPGRLIWWFKAAVLFLPSYVFLIVCGWRAIGGVDAPSRGVVAALRGLFLVACASPLVLNVVAWDYARWFALAVSNALICLLAFRASCRARPAEGGGGPLPLAAAMTIALGLAGDAIFFNGAKVSYYPFFDQWQALGDQIESGKIERPKD
ncbi:MAG TPA: hypothetical protein VNN80_03025, partial [Polyangiaceae bacterium]|nr:hypothetical protein [Polyangiaceae bacterium]